MKPHFSSICAQFNLSSSLTFKIAVVCHLVPFYPKLCPCKHMRSPLMGKITTPVAYLKPINVCLLTKLNIQAPCWKIFIISICLKSHLCPVLTILLVFLVYTKNWHILVYDIPRVIITKLASDTRSAWLHNPYSFQNITMPITVSVGTTCLL